MRYVFVCGAHSSGKTTLLKTLEKNQVINHRMSEIGHDLYYEQYVKTDIQGEGFEEKIATLELNRDFNILELEGVIGIETWHPGNIAYAGVRNPDYVKHLVDKAKKSPFLNNAIGIFLTVDKDTIIHRTKTFDYKKERAGDFYEKIDQQIIPTLNLLGLLERTKIIDANRPFEVVLDEVMKFLNEHEIY